MRLWWLVAKNFVARLNYWLTGSQQAKSKSDAYLAELERAERKMRDEESNSDNGSGSASSL